MVLFIWPNSEVVKLRKFKFLVSQETRQCKITTFGDTTTINITQPRIVKLDTQPIKLFVLVMKSLFKKLGQPYFLGNIAEKGNDGLICKKLIPQEIRRGDLQDWRLEAGVPGMERRGDTKPGTHARLYTP